MIIPAAKPAYTIPHKKVRVDAWLKPCPELTYGIFDAKVINTIGIRSHFYLQLFFLNLLHPKSDYNMITVLICRII